MENDNMSEFFRKKFNEDSSEEDWANPDWEVDQEVLGKITAKKKTRRRWLPIFWTIVGVLAVAAGAYALYSNYSLLKHKNQSENKNHFYKAQLTASNQVLQQLEKDNQTKADLIEEYKKRENDAANRLNASSTANQMNQSNNQVKNKPNQIDKSAKEKVLINQNQRLQDLNNKLRLGLEKESLKNAECNDQQQEYQLIIDSLRIEIQRTRADLPMALEDLIDSTLNLETIAAEQLATNEELIPLDTLPDEIKLELEKPNKRDKFDIGYDYAFQVSKFSDQKSLNYGTQWESSIGGINDVATAATGAKAPGGANLNSRLLMHSNGVAFGFSPTKNLWIRSGIRFATFNTNSSYQQSLSYSATEAYTNTSDGNTYNTRTVTVPTPFSVTEKEIAFGFSPNNIPNDGTTFTYQTWNRERVESWQMPLGIEYDINLGKSKTALYFQGGTLLNVLNIRKNLAQSILVDGGQNVLTMSSEEVISQQINNKISLDAYGEFGVQQTIFRGLYLRTAFNYSYNFYRQNESPYYPLSKHGFSLRVGLGYRF